MTEPAAVKAGKKKEHHQHQAMRSKAIGKIRKHSDAGGRLEEFLNDEVENFESLFAAAMQVIANAPTMTHEQLLANVRAIMNEQRLLIDDRRADIPEMVDLIAHGKVPKDHKSASGEGDAASGGDK